MVGLLAMTQGEDMTTALAKTLVNGLGSEGVEDVWSKLNRSNRQHGQREAFADGLLFYVDPAAVEKRTRQRRARYRREADAQLALFDQL